MTKEELIQSLEPFTDDIQICFENNQGEIVEVDNIKYDSDQYGNGIIILR